MDAPHGDTPGAHVITMPKRLVVLACLCSLTLSGACYGSEVDLSEIQRLMASGTPEGLEHAVRLLDKEVLADSKNFRARYLRSVALLDLGRYREAAEALESLTIDYPRVAEIFNNLGIAYFGLKEYSKAVRGFEEAIRLKPSYLLAHENLAGVYLSMADAALGRAIKLEPGNMRVARLQSLLQPALTQIRSAHVEPPPLSGSATATTQSAAAFKAEQPAPPLPPAQSTPQPAAVVQPITTSDPEVVVIVPVEPLAELPMASFVAWASEPAAQAEAEAEVFVPIEPLAELPMASFVAWASEPAAPAAAAEVVVPIEPLAELPMASFVAWASEPAAPAAAAEVFVPVEPLAELPMASFVAWASEPAAPAAAAEVFVPVEPLAELPMASFIAWAREPAALQEQMEVLTPLRLSLPRYRPVSSGTPVGENISRHPPNKPRQ